MKRILSILLMLVATWCFGQEDTLSFWKKRRLKKDTFALNNDSYKIGGLAITYSGSQDTRMSPLIFRGAGVNMAFDKLTYNSKRVRQWSFGLSYNPGVIYGPWSTPMHRTKVDIDYSYERKIAEPLGKLYVGGTFFNSLNTRFYGPLGNNAFGLDHSAGIAISSRWMKEHFITEKWMLMAGAKLSLFSLAVRFPEYAYFGTEIQFLPLVKYNRFNFEVLLSKRYNYSKENRWSAGYFFEAYRFGSSNDDKVLAQYIHGLKLAYWLKSK